MRIRLSRAFKASSLVVAGSMLLIADSAVAQRFADRADELLAAYHKAGILNGSVLVAQGDSVLYERGFGEAEKSWHIPNTPNTKFRIGSTTKQFTAALVHQLAEQGLVDLDAPISKYLPSYPAAQGRRVTVRQLLTQTSGIPNYTSLPVWNQLRRSSFAPDSFLRVFSGLALEFEPGSKFSYSNSNYFVLGVLIEHVTGQAYATALRTRLLEPLGLRDTGYDTRTAVVEQMASGYRRVDGEYAPERYVDVSLPYAAGMMYSTVRDLYRWKRALHRGAPFRDARTLARMLTPPGGAQYGYAHGLGVLRRGFGSDTVVVIGHGGHIEGFNADDKYIPEHDWTIIVLDNTNGDVGRVGNDLLRLLLGQSVTAPR